MNKQEKVKTIIKILTSLFPDPEIPLKFKNNYTFLIAVLLSARTTDKCVNKVTSHLFKKADCPKKMLAFSFEELKKNVFPCGLSTSKTKAILSLSKILIEKYQSKIPSSFKQLEALPGVGHKTASVIMALVFKKDAFPVDTHIMRCAKRWGLSKGTPPP